VLPTLEAELHQMGDDEYQVMLEALGDVHLESRLALLYFAAAGSDGELSDAEGEAVVAEVEEVLRQLGSEHDASKVLKFAARHLGDVELLEESVALLGAHLSQGMLASILASMRRIASADGESEDERSFLDTVTSVWSVSETPDDADLSSDTWADDAQADSDDESDSDDDEAETDEEEE